MLERAIHTSAYGSARTIQAVHELSSRKGMSILNTTLKNTRYPLPLRAAHVVVTVTISHRSPLLFLFLLSPPFPLNFMLTIRKIQVLSFIL